MPTPLPPNEFLPSGGENFFLANTVVVIVVVVVAVVSVHDLSEEAT